MTAREIVLTKCVPTWVGVNLPLGVVLTAPPETAERLVANGYARYVATEPEPELAPMEAEATDSASGPELDMEEEWETALYGSDDEEADDADES